MSVKSIENKIKEYGFVFAAAISGLTFAGAVLGNLVGAELTHTDFLLLTISTTLGYAGGRKIRDMMGGEGSDERDIENYEEGMTWGFVIFAVLVGVENGFGYNISSSVMLMYSTGVALTVSIYREIQQVGVEGVLRI